MISQLEQPWVFIETPAAKLDFLANQRLLAMKKAALFAKAAFFCLQKGMANDL